MDVFDKFFIKFAYKFPKGYPDMGDPNDVLLLEQMIKTLVPDFSFNYVKQTLLEEVSNKQISSNTKKAIGYLISKVDPSTGLKTQSDITRLGNPNKLSPEDLQKLFKDILGVENITIHAPKTGPNPSGKFSMYEMDTKDFGLVRIVVSGGGNEGEKYEQDFVSKAQQLAGTPNDDLPNDLKTLYNKLNIDNTKLKSDDISFAGATDTKRSLSLEGPKDVGKTIADIIVKYNNKEYYISLKNVAGSGVYSGPTIPFIYEKDGEVIYDESKLSSNEQIKILFDLLNIDPKRIASGINDYVDQTGEDSSFESVNIDTDSFKKLLASSLGYGYYYVRETGPEQIKVIPLLTAEDTNKAVGEIKKSEIKYPGKNTKQLTTKIETDSPIFGPSEYLVTIRNTQGKLLPLSLRIVKSK